jgi:FlaA1/EpsC-like NDP-sugar epimerase
VLASRGSVIPLFHEQIRTGGPITITTTAMTRFLLPLERAVDTIFAALEHAAVGETFVPKVPSAKMTDVAKALIGDRNIPMIVTGIRPGEKVHEIMVSEEEAWRTFDRGEYYAIKPMLPELSKDEPAGKALTKEYSSGDSLMDLEQTKSLLAKYNLLVDQDIVEEGEFLR